MINQFIQGLDRTTRLGLYNAFGTAMYIVIIVLFIWEIMTHAINRKEIIFLLISFSAAFALSPQICVLLDKATNGVIPERNLGIGFLPFLMVYMLLLQILKLRVTTGLDVAVPMYIGGRGICVIGCIFPGCCCGTAAEWGIYSHRAHCNTVPCPILDSFISIMIVLFMLGYSKKYGLRGKASAYGLIAFGILRFIIDLLRDNDKMFDLITFEGIFGFIYLCFGLIILYILDKKSAANPRND